MISRRPVGRTRSLEFVELDSEAGWIVYRRSVEFLLIMAVHELFPRAEVIAKFRANNGLYCEVQLETGNLPPELVPKVEAEMRRIVLEDRPIVKEVMARADAVRLFQDAKRMEKANLIASLNLASVSIYRCGGYYDYLYGAYARLDGASRRFALEPFEAVSCCARRICAATARCRVPYISRSSQAYSRSRRTGPTSCSAVT